MAEVIKMPKMSDTMTEGVIISWFKKEGDVVKSGDILAEVETDKATMELESYEDGVLLYIGAKEKDRVPVGGILAIIGKKGEDYKSLINEKTISFEKTDTDSFNKVDKQPETNVQENQIISENKVNEIPTETNITSENIEQKTEIKNDKIQSKSESTIESDIPNNNQQEIPQPSDQKSNVDISNRIKASPLAKKVAQEMGYDISSIKGTGEGGRIIRRDIEATNQVSKISNLQSPISPENTFNPVIFEENYVDVSVSSMRALIASKLTESLANAPHFYITSEINMSKVVRMKEITNKNNQNNISFNDIILKAVSLALRHYPEVNVSWLGNKIRKNKHIHIGVAVAIDEGLVVPVIRFVDTKNLLQISNEIKDLISKSKNKKLTLQDMEGSTFCISNLGMFGIDSFTSIINPPSACILAIGGINKKPIVNDYEQIEVGSVMKVTLSCDHRLVDGAIGAKFLSILKDILEEPISMLL